MWIAGDAPVTKRHHITARLTVDNARSPVSHVQGARCAERHRQRQARGIWRATAQRGAIGAAEAPANFVWI
eukprot:scaffold41937_cov48-Phaeocystis_antarctica.AAC.1